MPRTRVKICGITNEHDAELAVSAGADALGFNFYSKSARYITPKSAARICASLPPFVQSVGLFVDLAFDEMGSILKQVQLDVLQFHGNETPDYCEASGKRYVKAVRGTSAADILSEHQRYSSACGLLVDSMVDGQFGGTGKSFDWDILPNLTTPLILAGGLNVENVAEAIKRVTPFAVDVSGGVERTKGVKDANLMKNFVLAVQAADLEVS